MAKKYWAGFVLCAAAVWGFGLNAQESSIRFVGVPQGGDDTPRINIQVTAEDMARQRPPLPQVAPYEIVAVGETPVPDATGAHDGASSWFWNVVSAQMPADAQRFWDAQAHLAEAPEVAGLGAPRLDTVTRIANQHGREILGATVGTSVSPAFVLAVIAAESSGRPEAVSGAGAQGLMQLIPATAERFGVEDPFDPAQNIAGGVAYLDWLMGEFGNDPVLVLAAYNAGEGAVRRSGGVPPYDETRTYVPRVLAAWTMARSMCITPPELISDGCVFQTMNGGG